MSLVVTDETFYDEVVLADKPVVVDLWADWCGPCKAISPIIEQLGEENAEIKVVKVNVDENPVTAAHYNVRSIPTILVFKDQQITASVVGAKPKKKLLEEISAGF